MTFVQGPKGVPQLIIRNHVYIRHCGKLDQTSYWKCRLYDRGMCKARCRTGVNDVVLTGVHTHLPDLNWVKNRVVVGQFMVYIPKQPHDYKERSMQKSSKSQVQYHLQSPYPIDISALEKESPQKHTIE